MQEGKLEFKDIFDGGRILEIPIYQRAYTWEEKQLKDFLEDLKNQPEEEKYFFGTFLFHDKGEDETGFRKLDVVDGQQRITTAIIFIKTLLDIIKNLDITEEEKRFIKRVERRYIKDEDIYKLKPSNNNTAFFFDYILNDSKPPAFESKAQKRLIKAKEFFTNELKKLSKEELKSLLKKLENAVVLVHTVSNSKDASQIFELINDRGKKLTDLEALKSFLMYKTSLSGNYQLLEKIEDCFSNIYRISERIEGKLDENKILSYYVIGFLKWTKEEEYSKAKDFIKELINKNELTISEFCKELEETFYNSKKIVFNEDNIKAIDNLKMINRIAMFYPLFLKIYKNSDINTLEEVANLTYKFAFVSLVAGLRSDTGRSYFYTLARDFDGDNPEELINKIKAIFDENWWNIKERFKANLYNIYHGNLAKYILFLYENILREKNNQKPLDINDYFENEHRYKLSIEHILAKDIAKNKFSSKFQNEYLDLIGNLVIDYQGANASKGNKPVDVKKESFKQNNEFLSQQEIEDIEKEVENQLSEKFDWENEEHVKAFIKYRTEKIMNTIKEIDFLKEIFD
ncbi:MAG TPA: DUF262 domain-containing protein [Nautiliaceae bacterium]|nr:DUF262 domain-containing protein [Nautiliaceae bacterium]